LKALVAAVALLCSVAAVSGCQTAGGSASSLKVGDCFNTTSNTDANGDPVVGYAVVDCTGQHDGEMFSAFDYPNAGAWPGYEQLGSIEQTRCEADFQTYVGIPWESSSFTINYAAPTETTWGSGDHTIRCLLESASAGKLTGSAKNSAK
jgi:hypothetical protein